MSCNVSEKQHSKGKKLLYFATLLAFKPPPDGGVLRKIFRGCQWMAKVPNAEEKLPKIFTGSAGRTNVTDDRQTDGRAIAYIANVNVSSRSLKTACFGRF